MEKVKELLKALGLKVDLDKIEAGELDPTQVATDFLTKHENAVIERKKTEIEKAATIDAMGKAYGKTEKIIFEAFGLKEEQFEGVDKNDRLKHATKLIQSSFDEERQKFSQGGDREAMIKQLDDQLKEANKKLKEKDKEKEEAIKAIQGEYAKKEQQVKFSQALAKKIKSIENPALDEEIMEGFFMHRMNQSGYSYEIADDKIWMLKDGNRVKHPESPTENLDLETLFDMTAKDKKFAKESSGGSGGHFKIDDVVNAGKNRLNPNFINDLKS